MRSIQEKINAYVIIGFLVLFFLLIFIIDREMNGSIVPLSKDLTQQIVDAKSEQISNWVEERIDDVKNFGMQIEYSNMSPEIALNYLKKVANDNKNYESLGLINSRGNAYISDGSHFSVLNREYYKRILDKDMDFVISNPIKSQSNNEDIIIILYKMDHNKYDLKYISAAVPIETIKNVAAKIKLYDGSSTIYDKNLEPIGFENKNNDKSNLIGFSAPISKSPNWTVMFKIPEDRLYEGTKRLKYSTILIGSIIGGLLVVFLSFFSSSIVRPIRNMQVMMKKVEEGNLNIRFGNYRKDELGDLQKSFDQMLDNLYAVKYEKREIELKLIQEQVNPHFLYNTLDTIRWSAIEYDAIEVVDLIEALSTYFRVGLSKGKKYISVREEISHLNSYLQIYQARFEKKLDYEFIYDENILEYKVIKVLLQPLVENAINHGNPGDKYNDFKIKIYIYIEGNHLIMDVKNNGENISSSRMDEINSNLQGMNFEEDRIGFGLYSVNQRLKLAFGEDYGLDIYNVSDGVLSRLNNPIIEED